MYLSDHVGGVNRYWGKSVQDSGDHDNKIPSKFPMCRASPNKANDIRQPPVSRTCASSEFSDRSTRDHAGQPDADQPQECLGISSWDSHVAASGVGPPDRDSTTCGGGSGTRGATSQSRDGPNDGKHVAGTAKSTHGTAKFGCQSDQSNHSSDIQDLKASNFSGRIDQCESNDTADQANYLSNDESSGASTVKCSRFSWGIQPSWNGDIVGGSRGGGDPDGRDDRSGHDQHVESSDTVLSCSCLTASDRDKSTTNCGRLGPMPSDLGQETQGQDLSGGLSDRSRLLSLEPGTFSEPARESEGFCQVRADMDSRNLSQG